MTIQERDVAVITDVDLSHAVQSDACVLFTGDDDTAEALARRLHALSGWRSGPFVAVDCAQPDTETRLLQLLDVDTCDPPEEATGPRLAQCGTVFLREVGHLAPAVQTRLSDRLATLKMRPHGGPRLRRRVVCSTSTRLEARVHEGTFDARLFYRLNVIHMVIPSNEHRW